MFISFFNNQISYGQCTPTTTSYASQTINSNQVINTNMHLASGTTILITNCTLQFAPGVRIICDPGSVLQIVSATLTASAGTAWHGIELVSNPANTFGSGAWCELEDATIANSYIGIDAGMGSSVSSIYSLFDANYIGIRLGTGSTWNAISFTIAETRFTSSTNLLSGCANWPPFGTLPLAIILAERIGTLDMTPFVFPSVVTFDNLNNGIVSLSENCIVRNCKFEFIRNYDNYNFAYEGCGVFATGGHAASFMNVNGTGNPIITPLRFFSCDIGVQYDRIRPTIANCDMDQINEFGILGGRTLGVFSAFKNTINTYRHGIFVNDVTIAAGVYIDQNDININTVMSPAVVIPNDGEAIHLAALVPNANYMQITNNHIIMQNGVAGIRCVGISYPINQGIAILHEIYLNNIEIDHSLQNSIGIAILACDVIRVKCNNVFSTIAQGNLWHEGIHMDACINALIGCNVLTNTRFGMFVTGVCNNSAIDENHFRNHRTGLAYTATAIVGIQNFTGNTWSIPSVLDAENLGNIFLNRFFYNGVGTPFEPATVSPNIGWFIQQNGIDPSTCPESPFPFPSTQCPPFVVENDTLDLEMANKVANNEFVTNEFEQGILESEKELLFRKIEKGQIAASSSTQIQNFYSNNLQTKYGKYSVIEDKFSAINTITNAIAIEAFTYKTNLLSELSNAASAFSSLSLNSNQGDIHNAMIAYNSVLNSGLYTLLSDPDLTPVLLTQLALEITSIKNEIVNITETDDFATNRKDVLKVVCKIIEGNVVSLNQNEIDFIDNLAFDCPYIKGDAVFIAQVAYNIIHSIPANFDNTAQCLPYGVNYKMASNSNVNVNQSNEIETKISLNSPDSKSLEVFDLTGRLVYSNKYPSNLTFEPTFLRGVVYIIKYTDYSNKITYNKLLNN